MTAKTFDQMTTAEQSSVCHQTMAGTHVVRRCGHVEEKQGWEMGAPNGHERSCGSCRAVEVSQAHAPAQSFRGEW